MRLSRACVLGTGVVPAEVPHSLEVAVEGGCFCGEVLVCDVSVGPGVIDLTSTECIGPYACDECFPSVAGTCELPPLAEGTYRVRVNGTEAFDLPVSFAVPAVAVSRCWTLAPPVDGGLFCDWPGPGLDELAQICHTESARPGESVEITVVDTCASCFDVAGACMVQLSGFSLEVSPLERHCDCPTCGVCEDICERLEMRCTTPPLPPGDYDVVYGERVSRLVVAEGPGGPTVCSGVATGGGGP